MFPVHCNKCCKKRDEHELHFQLTRCHHIICASCTPKATDRRMCPVCNRDFKSIPITRNMPGKTANYFEDPSIFLKMYQNVSKFQSEQRVSYYHYFYKQQTEMANRKLKMQGYIKLDAQLRQQNDVEKKRIEELRNYIAYHEKRNDPSNSADMFRASRRMCRPRTPSSLSVSDTTLITDSNDVLNKNPNLKEFKQMLSQTLKSELKKV